MVVIFLFLGSFRSVIVPIVAIPISLIGALFLMQVFGFTLNLLTLLAIVLSVGLVVDDAIVVVENVERHMREGLSRMNAALLGARELVGPIIAMTITLAAVYTPIALQGGSDRRALPRIRAHAGRRGLHFRRRRADAFADDVGEFAARRNTPITDLAAWSIALSIACAIGTAAISIALCSARPAVYTVWIGVSLLAVFMFMMMPNVATKELAPKEDQGVIFGIITAPANATIDDTISLCRCRRESFSRHPGHAFHLSNHLSRAAVSAEWC